MTYHIFCSFNKFDDEQTVFSQSRNFKKAHFFENDPYTLDYSSTRNSTLQVIQKTALSPSLLEADPGPNLNNALLLRFLILVSTNSGINIQDAKIKIFVPTGEADNTARSKCLNIYVYCSPLGLQLYSVTASLKCNHKNTR